MKQPCKADCERRSPYCRSSCKDWTIYEQARNESYKKRVILLDVSNCVTDGVLRVKKAQHTRPKRGMV